MQPVRQCPRDASVLPTFKTNALLLQSRFAGPAVGIALLGRFFRSPKVVARAADPRLERQPPRRVSLYTSANGKGRCPSDRTADRVVVMDGLIPMTVACALAAVVVIATGWWRYAFTPWSIRARTMTVDRLGLHVAPPADVQRVNRILAGFSGGFNHMIARPSGKAWLSYCESLPTLCQPFAHEGAAMGYTLRHLFRYDPGAFEREIVKPRSEFRYLYYVGLGFWSGIRNHKAAKLSSIVTGLDPLHRYLCYDGYGFKHAFFDYPKDASSLRKLDTLGGYARNVAYQGVGRAFFFRYMSRPDLLIEHVERLGDYAEDAAAGAGLAAVFIYPDRLEVARELAKKVPPDWQSHFHLGMCFGLKARSINNVDQFERDIAGLAGPVQDAIRTSVRECDRIELLVRAEADDNGYQTWRSRVAEWMTENIEYPLASVKTTNEPRAVATPRTSRGI